MSKNVAARLTGRFAARSRFIVRRFAKGRGGVAAVEFALMLPIMLSVWVGMVITTDAISADKKVTLLARTLADITTQSTTVTQADMDTIFRASSQLMFPHPATAMGMRVTSIDIDANGKAFVDWSFVPSDLPLKGAFSAVARCQQTFPVPASLKIPRTSLVYAEVEMNYSASIATDIVRQLFGSSYSGDKFALKDNLYMRPRQSTKVVANPAQPPCSGYTP